MEFFWQRCRINLLKRSTSLFLSFFFGVYLFDLVMECFPLLVYINQRIHEAVKSEGKLPFSSSTNKVKFTEAQGGVAVKRDKSSCFVEFYTECSCSIRHARRAYEWVYIQFFYLHVSRCGLCECGTLDF